MKVRLTVTRVVGDSTRGAGDVIDVPRSEGVRLLSDGAAELVVAQVRTAAKRLDKPQARRS